MEEEILQEKKQGKVVYEDSKGLFVLEWVPLEKDAMSGISDEKEFDDSKKLKKKKKQSIEIISLKGDESDGH